MQHGPIVHVYVVVELSNKHILRYRKVIIVSDLCADMHAQQCHNNYYYVLTHRHDINMYVCHHFIAKYT